MSGKLQRNGENAFMTQLNIYFLFFYIKKMSNFEYLSVKTAQITIFLLHVETRRKIFRVTENAGGLFVLQH